MTSYGSRSQALTGEQSDLKKIKQKYSSQLSSLKELFADWSDDDLLFALKEVEGDLYLAIDRISEGHVTQWGEVKSKKSKKEAAQKAKSSTAPAPISVSQTTAPYRNERPPPARGNNDRSRRGGRGGHNSRAQKQSNVQAPAAATWSTSAPSRSFQSSSDGGSWAAVASSKMNDSSWGASTDNIALNATTTTTSTNWDAPTNNTTASNDWDTKGSETVTEQPAPEITSTINTPTPETKTWASLLKSQPKPEPEPAKKEEPGQELPTNEQSNTANGTSWDAPSNDGWDAKDPWSTTADEPTGEASKDVAPVTEEATVPWTSVEPEIPKIPVNEFSPKESEIAIASAPAPKPAPVAEEQSPKDEPIITTKKASTRRLKQDEPVVLPNTGASLSSIGVKFGSLSLDDATIETTEITQTTLQSEPSVQDETKQENQAQTERLDGLSSSLQTQQQQQQVPQETISQQSHQTPIQQQQTQHQHQHQQLFGLDPLASGYSSYLPNQPPAGVSGFGVSPMGSLPEYNLYGADAHRAAMLQGYYDPTAYNQSASTNTYQSRDKHNQDGVGSLPQHTGAQTPGATAQQMYPVNMPYYQYYYMPNQFTYQQAAYGQPYMNKNMYPNMYQHSTGKPNAGSATSPYGAAGSPYSQNMYGQSVSGGYDDMSGLQHLNGMSLHDYQKPYQQLPNFLGAAASATQQPQQTQQPGAGGPQQSTGKNDKAGGPASGTTTGNGHHHPQQQPQGYQHPAATGNYFNQSFQYQQQYPQHQQQFPHFQQQAAQQQQTPSGQPSPMGRQQPYWSQ